MKNLFIAMSGIFMIPGSTTITHGQKIMALNEGLKTRSAPMEAKRKGMNSVGKSDQGGKGIGRWQGRDHEEHLRL